MYEDDEYPNRRVIKVDTSWQWDGRMRQLEEINKIREEIPDIEKIQEEVAKANLMALHDDEKLDSLNEAFVKETTKKCYKIEIVEDKEPGILDDKIGGLPYLPIGEEYPKDSKDVYMELFAQINFKNIKLDNFPNDGILELFMGKENEEYEVRYYKEGLEYQTNFDFLDEDWYDFMIIDEPLKIKYVKDKQSMPSQDYRVNDVMCKVIKDVTGDITTASLDYFEKEHADLWDEIDNNREYAESSIGGYAEFIQTDPREYEDDLQDKTECLLFISEELDSSISLGGSVALYISKEDLKNANFKNAYFDYQAD